MPRLGLKILVKGDGAVGKVTAFTRWEELPEFLTVKELQAYFRISASLAYKLVTTGEIETLRLGRRHLIPRRALEKLQAPR